MWEYFGALGLCLNYTSFVVYLALFLEIVYSQVFITEAFPVFQLSVYIASRLFPSANLLIILFLSFTC